MKKIILIDGHNLLFRMFYGIPSPIRNSANQDIRGLIGFIGSLKKIVNEFNPYSVYVIFDSETSKNSNLEIDNSYKANRIDYRNVAPEENPFTQLPFIKEALTYLNIPYLEVENNETDDLIASIVSKSTNDYQYIIVSTDSDFIQLVDTNVFLYVPRGKKSLLYTKEKVIEKYKIPPQKYIIFKSLVGDKSDNIKGIHGIGPITASTILKYNSIQEFILNNPTSKLANLLQSNQELINKNQKLITMNKHLDTSTIIFNELSYTIYNSKTYEIIESIGKR